MSRCLVTGAPAVRIAARVNGGLVLAKYGLAAPMPSDVGCRLGERAADGDCRGGGGEQGGEHVGQAREIWLEGLGRAQRLRRDQQWWTVRRGTGSPHRTHRDHAAARPSQVGAPTARQDPRCPVRRSYRSRSATAPHTTARGHGRRDDRYSVIVDGRPHSAAGVHDCGEWHTFGFDVLVLDVDHYGGCGREDRAGEQRSVEHPQLGHPPRARLSEQSAASRASARARGGSRRTVTAEPPVVDGKGSWPHCRARGESLACTGCLSVDQPAPVLGNSQEACRISNAASQRPSGRRGWGCCRA